jgi:hypothetical protein
MHWWLPHFTAMPTTFCSNLLGLGRPRMRRQSSLEFPELEELDAGRSSGLGHKSETFGGVVACTRVT